MNLFYILLPVFLLFHFTKRKKKKSCYRTVFLCCLGLSYFYCRIACSSSLNCDQMEEGEQYSEYSVERNPRAYMLMRDYRNLPWQNQRPLGRNPNPSRSMRDYKNQWMSATFCSVSPTNAPFDNHYNPSWGNHTNSSWEPKLPQFAPPASPYYATTPQPQQPPQLTSSVEQTILNLSKLVDNFKEEHRAVNVQANQEINTVESSMNKELDGFQSEIDQKFDIIQESILEITNQLVHQKEENPEKECLIDTTVEEEYKQQDEAISPLLTEEGSGKETMEGTQKPILQPIPINLDPNATAKPKNSPLPVHILPSPASQSQPKTPAAEAKAIPPLLPTQYFRKLVATAKIFATTSKKLAAAHTTWHSGWFGCWFRHGVPGP